MPRLAPRSNEACRQGDDLSHGDDRVLLRRAFGALVGGFPHPDPQPDEGLLDAGADRVDHAGAVLVRGTSGLDRLAGPVTGPGLPIGRVHPGAMGCVPALLRGQARATACRSGYDREWRADPKLSGGGELIDQGVHLIDLASWFLGSFPTVEGHAATFFWDMKVDDNAFLSLRTAKGQTAWLHVSCTEWKNLFSLEIYGRDGKIAVDGLGGSYGTERLTYYKMLPQMGPPETQTWDYPSGDDSWAAETRAFVEDIRQGRTPSPGLQEGIRTLEIVESIYKKSGYPIS